MEENRPGYYAIIPADVRYDDAIPANAKLLYGEVAALIGKEGYCFASNQYFADVFGFSLTSVTRLLSQLEKGGYIIRRVVKDREGKVELRKIYLSVSIPDIQPPTKIGDTPHQSCGEGTPKIGEYTNTSITDIKENKKEKAKRVSLEDSQLKDHWIDWIRSVAGDGWTVSEKNFLYSSLMAFYAPRETKKQEPARTATACSRLGKLLLQYSGGNPTAMCLILDRSTASGWKSVFPLNQPGHPGQRPAGEENVKWI